MLGQDDSGSALLTNQASSFVPRLKGALASSKAPLRMNADLNSSTDQVFVINNKSTFDTFDDYGKK